MAYDNLLAQRIRKALARRREVSEKRMFGGLCFLLDGRMLCGIVGDELMLRVGPQGYENALAQPHAREMDFTGRPMRGMIYVAPPGIASEAALNGWLRRATEFASATPAKPATSGKRAKASGKGGAKPKPKALGRVGQGSAGAFSGFPPAAFAFLRGIAQHNDKPWFQAHPAEYHALYDTGIAFASAIGPKLAKLSPLIRWEPRINGSVFRIQRDIRFSKDKTPYKPHLDLWIWAGQYKGWDVPGCFFRMYARRLILGSGMHALAGPQLAAYRRAVVHPNTGKALAALLARLDKAGYVLAEATRKQVPRGYDPGHARADLLLREGLHASYDGPVPRDASSAQFTDFCLKHFRATWPVSQWLIANVLK